jgi:HSP90 family molecular chaperone
VELLRELVNNSYDANASEVKILIAEDKVTAEDNGSGIDLDGLSQYFNIGSPFKKENPKSPVYARTRIGEFGIGKFSTLSACESFYVSTRKGGFAAGTYSGGGRRLGLARLNLGKRKKRTGTKKKRKKCLVEKNKIKTRALIVKVIKFLSREEIKKYYMKRTRPRKQGKPL